jgi:hypothetical protein
LPGNSIVLAYLNFFTDYALDILTGLGRLAVTIRGLITLHFAKARFSKAMSLSLIFDQEDGNLGQPDKLRFGARVPASL